MKPIVTLRAKRRAGTPVTFYCDVPEVGCPKQMKVFTSYDPPHTRHALPANEPGFKRIKFVVTFPPGVLRDADGEVTVTEVGEVRG